MKTRLSYKNLQLAYDSIDRDLTLTRIGLQCVLHEQLNAGVTVYEDEGKPHIPGCASYRYRLYRAAAPHGGILLITFRCHGQSPSTTAHYYEDFRHMPSLAYHEKIAMERLALKYHGAHAADDSEPTSNPADRPDNAAAER